MEQRSVKGVSSFVLKVFAIIGMTLDHVGNIFFGILPLEVISILFAFGGLTFPIMAFLIGEGFRHTSSFKRYALRLLLFAVIAQVPYSLFLYPQGNVLFTLFLGLVVLFAYERLENRVLFAIVLVLCTAGSIMLDWGVVGVLMIFLYYVLKDRTKRVLVPLVLPVVAFLIPSMLSLIATGNLNSLPSILFVVVGCSLTIPLLWSYNGSRGRPLKYFFYIYYPLHIALIGIVYEALRAAGCY